MKFSELKTVINRHSGRHDKIAVTIEKNGHAFVRFGMNGWVLELKAKGWHGETKIQYCPMCGRKL